MVGPQLSVLVSFHEDVIVSRSDSDVVIEFLDVFVRELVEEMNDQSSGNFIDLDPRRMDGIFVSFSNSFGFIAINFEKFLRLDDIEAEVVVFPDLLFSRDHSLD